VKSHAFFQEVNWEKLLKLQYETPNVELFDDMEYHYTRANFIDYDYKQDDQEFNFIYGFNVNAGNYRQKNE
jgi:hypothetical protein